MVPPPFWLARVVASPLTSPDMRRYYSEPGVDPGCFPIVILVWLSWFALGLFIVVTPIWLIWAMMFG